jgi:hypothetical protein
MKSEPIKTEVGIKSWAKPVVWLFVFLGMYPPKWVFYGFKDK